ncbi:hypothetical protein [Aminobacter aminovorans]|uniref:hypothetical protein n=1 Tax=Aminobacter aminovorans TaxID=83263 RepID=UPI00285B01EF|nr:hypothetical protein [Aminobacter aminovorans]MDR7222818.1 hypothetical protein [Aminobacter aminovorans]
MAIARLRYLLVADAKLHGNLGHRSRPDQLMKLGARQLDSSAGCPQAQPADPMRPDIHRRKSYCHDLVLSCRRWPLRPSCPEHNGNI